MTPETDTTATRPASAIRHRRPLDVPRHGLRGRRGISARRGLSERNRAAPAILRLPSLVWLIGSTPWAIAAVNGFPGISGALASSFLTVGVICFAATVASLLPIRNLAHGPADALPLGLLATVAVRGGTTLSLLIGSIAVGWLERDTVALPIVLWYMAFLVSDLVVVNRFLSNALPISVRRHSERTTC